MDVDVIAGLDMMVQRGQWDRALETAEQQVITYKQVSLSSSSIIIIIIIKQKKKKKNNKKK